MCKYSPPKKAKDERGIWVDYIPKEYDNAAGTKQREQDLPMPDAETPGPFYVFSCRVVFERITARVRGLLTKIAFPGVHFISDRRRSLSPLQGGNRE